MRERAVPVSGAASSDPRTAFLRVARILGAVAGYGCIAAFLSLISAQIYRWLRDGQWTHVGVSDGLSAALTRCCVNDGDTGRLAALVRWLDAPVDWLGLHRVLELLPASLALFALAILGNSLFIYCCDRLDQRQRGA